VTLLAAVLMTLSSAGAEGDPRAAALFVHALRNNSSAPEYVLFTLRSPGRADQVVCAEAPFLLGALQTELGPGKDAVKFAEGRAETRLFELKQPRAIHNVGPHYSAEILAEVRGKLSGLGREALTLQLRSRDSPLHKLYKGKHGGEWQAYRNAVAHVLLSQGVPVGRGDPVGDLYGPDVKVE
jgi:hypothetical protein